MEKIAQKTGKESDWAKHSKMVDEYEALEKKLKTDRMGGQNITPAFLAIKKPAVMDAKGETFTTLSDEINSFLKEAKKNGHDGAIIKNLDDDPGFSDRVGNHFVIFDPKQAKSAIGNSGEFNPKKASLVASGLGAYLTNDAAQK